jgi:serine protease
VVSLSLGGEGGPLRTYQDVIDAAAARNVLFVVAAGNDNTNASTFTPCNQEGVLCIGATRFNGRRASYSNYGPRIDLMAPGGETGEDANGDGNPDGVLSTVRIDSTGRPGYQFEQGTSMAAPHIAGVLSLMKARNATMGFAQARAILVETTNRASQCDEGCGAGLVNVHAALLRVSGTMPNGPARLSLSATDLFFTPQTRSQTLTVTNVGGLSLTASFSATGPQARRIRFDSDTVSVSPGQTASIQVTADLAGLADGMTEAATISVTSNGGNATVGAKLRVGGNSARNVVVALVFQQGTEWQVAAAVEAQSIENFSYALDVSPGTYFVFGAQDTNGNQQFDDGEPIGFWPNSDSPKTLTVTPGSNAPGTNFVVAPQKALTGDESRLIGTSCTDDSMCGADGICGTGFPSGYCTRDCATTACPAGSRCLSGNMVSLCLEVCTAPRTGRSTCRAQYVCENDGAGTGICIPDCSAVNVCGTSQTCNTASGYCE